jgi:4-hydroxy 2-oxovalerate aldolase
MKIVDVTLRDGGFTCDFDWSLKFAQDYYSLVSKMGCLVELGYWKQSSKSKNRFFNLDLDSVKKVTNEQQLNNCCIMIDYHYCSKNLDDYPTKKQKEIKLIRMTCRKDILKEGFQFAVSLKKATGLDVSLNLFNTTNYTNSELDKALDLVLDSDIDIIGFADTHGHLNLDRDLYYYKGKFDLIKRAGKKTCLHLHNHTGQAFHNYKKCKEINLVDFCDTSIGGLGKGAGNLKLEEIASTFNCFNINCFIEENYDLFSNNIIKPHYMVTGRFGITDNYASQAIKNKINTKTFYSFCDTINGLDRDNFDPKLLKDYIKYNI